MNKFATQHATCTSGPSLPSHIPEPTERHYGNVSSNLTSTIPNPTYQPQCLCDKSPRSQETADDEASQNRFHLGYTAVPGVYRILLDQRRRKIGQGNLHGLAHPFPPEQENKKRRSRRTENIIKKKYSKNHLPPAPWSPNASPHVVHPEHLLPTSYPRQQTPLFR